MNWKRGFRRITLVLAILAAVTCGCAGFFISMDIHPYDKEYGYMSFRPIEKQITANKIYITDLEKQRAAIEEQIVSSQIKLDGHEKRGVRLESKNYDSSYAHDLCAVYRKKLNELENDLTATKTKITKAKALQNQLQNKLSGSKAKLVGFYVLAGLVPAAIGFCVIWIIYYLIKWLILGFAVEKITDKQNQ